MGSFVQELGRAARALVRRPFFTIVAGATLATGIGANAAIFGVVDSVLINSLPYPDSDRILSVTNTAPGLGLPIVPFSEAMFLQYEGSVTTLAPLALYEARDVNLVGDGGPERLPAARVTRELFDVFGQTPALGRAFAPGEDRLGAEPVVILGHDLWQRAFGGDPALVGSLVELDGVRRRVVGVMPEGFAFPREVELWIPFEIDEAEPDAGAFSYPGVGRLAPGADVAAANRELDALLLRFSDANADDLPRSVLEQAGLRADAKPLKELYVADVERTLWIVLGTVGFVLLIACANVANLFLVRAEGRRREQALRTALGAGRADHLRHGLAESLVLGLGSGVAGLGLAVLALRLLRRIAPVGLPRAQDIGIDTSVLLYTLLVTVLASVLFGLVPGLGSGRGDLVAQPLKEGGRATTVGRARHRTRSGLVVAQVALALVLLVGSGLMIRSFEAIRAVDPGFDASSRLTFRLSLPPALYPDAASARAFYRAVEERMAAVPGVSAVAIASSVPLADTKSATNLEPADRPTPEGDLGPIVDLRWVGPGYFETMGIELLEGRGIADEDGADGVRAVVVSERLARSFWPGEASVVGRRVQGDTRDAGWEVVGVARDVRYEKLDVEPGLLAYFPLVTGDGEPAPVRAFNVVLRATSAPLALVPAAREALREVDPRLPIVDPRTVASVVEEARATTSFAMVLLAIAAGIALLLGTVGIYGVVSYVTGQRTQEIGVRMALGAPGGRVLRGVIGGGLGLAGVGVALGLVGSLAASRLLASMLYGVSPHDPLTYGATAVLLAAVAVVASWIPARRAARVDPVRALRAD